LSVNADGTQPASEDPRVAERDLALGIADFTYADTWRPERLEALNRSFHAFLAGRDGELHDRFRRYHDFGCDHPPEEGDLLVAVAAHLSAFLGQLWGIGRELTELGESYTADQDLFRFKTAVVKKIIAKQARLDEREHPPADVCYERFEILAALLEVDEGLDEERRLAVASMRVHDRLKEYKRVAKKPDSVGPATRDWVRMLHAMAQELDFLGGELADDPVAEKTFLEQVAHHLHDHGLHRYREQEGLPKEERWASFLLPEPLDFHSLVPSEPGDHGGIVAPTHRLRRRDGFALTDPRMDRPHAIGEVDYCLYCYSTEKDSCSKGFWEKDHPEKRKPNPLGLKLTGCPLDQKISESHTAANQGDPLGGLAIITIDNPLCPGTGHRICNECMRSCIYQKQDPVDIPQIETRLLVDVLSLPYGPEIYQLLTRWNPLNRLRPHALPHNGKKILVVGMGPAGYALAHYLSKEGFGVVGIDGLKLEPLPDDLTGRDCGLPRPIRDWEECYEHLDERILAGFGGVSEYGITVRWDKNFLNLLYLTLTRRELIRCHGGVRFGGTIDIDQAWELGFDHIALATGAGKPTIVPMQNNLIDGIRKASDFLMTLQLTGAAKRDSLASLQVRLPAVVIGGGLTGIDTATEVFAYYPVMVEKCLERWERLRDEGRLEEFDAWCGPGDCEVLDEYLEHGRAVRAERERAVAAGEQPDFVPLVRGWGGVTMVYRKRLVDSPAYRLNHEEVAKALEEGIEFLECHSPVEAVPDEVERVRSVVFERQYRTPEGSWRGDGHVVNLPARCVLIAAGTSPNTIYEKERPGTFRKDEWGHFFRTYHAETHTPGGRPELVEGPGFFTSYQEDGRCISLLGDNHPVFAGNVVKAMASAKHGFPEIVGLFNAEIRALDPADQAVRDARWRNFAADMDDLLSAEVVRVERLTPTIVEVVIRAPLAARNFRPGQFYRVQRYESHSPVVDGTRIATEGMALTGAWVDRDEGLLSTIVLEVGHSSRVCADLRPGEPIVCMGPTGTPTTIPENSTVLLIGGGLGNAVLFSIAAACREKGSRVIYFAGYKDARDIYKYEELLASTDALVVCCDVGEPPEPARPQDRIFHGNIVEAMVAYGSGDLGEQAVPLAAVDRLVVIGSDRMMAAVKRARFDRLADILPRDHVAIGSINSPMQCMMKEICAQCLQKHVNPETGVDEYVFSCFDQDQALDAVCFEHLNLRLRGNSLLEKLNNAYLTRLFELRDEPVPV